MRQQSRPRLLRTMGAYAAAIAIVASALWSYGSQFSPSNRWQADNNDPADYRFVAEYFWGVPFHADTYDPIWHGGWGDYLRTIPFRGIGIGTLYLGAGWLRYGHAPATTTEVNGAGVLLAYAEKALLAGSLLTLFAVVRRRWGNWVGLLAIAVTAYPVVQWRISDDFLTEPAHRIVFVLAMACAVAMTADPTDSNVRRRLERLSLLLIALWIVAAQIKVQWYVGAFLLLPALLVQYWRAGASVRAVGILVLATLAVPLSVIVVNWVGWRNTSLSPGLGLHVNLKYDQDVLRQYSAANAGRNDRPALADSARPRLRWWYIYVGPELTAAQYADFDRFARRYLAAHAASAARSLVEGLELASTVPGVERVQRGGLLRLVPLEQPWRGLVRVADVATWVLLMVGLAFDETRIACALGLALWIVPAIGHVVSPYELRYHLPMAGLGSTAAAIVVARIAGNRYN